MLYVVKNRSSQVILAVKDGKTPLVMGQRTSALSSSSSMSIASQGKGDAGGGFCKHSSFLECTSANSCWHVLSRCIPDDLFAAVRSNDLLSIQHSIEGGFALDGVDDVSCIYFD